MKISRRSFIYAALILSLPRWAAAWRNGYALSIGLNLVLASSSSTPGLTFNFVLLPNVGDVIQMRDGVSPIGTYTITQADINNGSFTLGLSALASGVHTLSARQLRPPISTLWSNAVTVTV